MKLSSSISYTIVNKNILNTDSVLAMQKHIYHYWPPFTLFAVTIILFFTNYAPETFLTGWDNLHPEFYFTMNIQRSFFAVWQEYQSLGLLGGMGHASDLFRQVFLLLLSFIVPLSMLRYLWTFLMLLSGALGAYYLIRYILFQAEKHHHYISTLSFLGALFYLLNWATMQTFFAPFEAFIAHFGFLPWLLLASLYFYQQASKKALLLFIVTLLITTPQAYIPTLFVVYLLALTIIVGTLFITHCIHNPKEVKQQVFRILILYTVIILVNSFWLFPFAYFTKTSVSVNLSSKINQMATQTIFDQNKAFGDASDVMLLKGFWFDNVDPNIVGQYDFMLKPWRTYVQNPMVQVAGYLFFILVLLGIYHAIKSKHPLLLGVSLLFLFSFTALATATPPFSWINTLFRTTLPVLNQAFRFPFTKFSILTALVYAICISIGLRIVLEKLYHVTLKIRKTADKTYLISQALLLFVVGNLILFISAPSFQGHLLYEKQRLSIPRPYFQTFEYFKNQDPHTRIANFPQTTFWGWGYYNWGYGGSGFLWYGIKQPILDRAFDVWSTTSENYYYEITQALYSKNPKALVSVFNKYQISYLLVDKYMVSPTSGTTTYMQELESLLSSISEVKKEKEFGKIAIYKVKLKDNPKSFVFTTPSLPSVNAYTWTEIDTAYHTLSNYIAQPIDSTEQKRGAINALALQLSYPFRSLFSQKTDKEKMYRIKEGPQTIEITSQITIPASITTLTLPAISGTEKIVPVDITTTKENGQTLIQVTLSSPTVFLGKQKIAGEALTQPLFSVQPTVSFPITLNVNGVSSYTITKDSGYIGTTFLSLTQDNVIVLSDATQKLRQSQTIPKDALLSLSLYKEQTISLPLHAADFLKIQIPKISDSYTSFTGIPSDKQTITNCNQFTEKGGIKTEEKGNASKRFVAFSSSDATACIAFYSPSLPHDLGYAIFIDNQHVAGRGFHFWILNEDERTSPLDTYLPSDKTSHSNSFLLPPQEDFGKAYSLHFENIAIGPDEVNNNLTKVSMYPIPYTYITNISSSTLPADSPNVYTGTSSGLTISHPNESLYTVSGATKGQTIVLSQSFDAGWKAYEVSNTSFITQALPFLFGKEVKNHVMVNNWENGWVLSDTTAANHLIIVYLPQYLEYLGFLLLLATLSIVFIKYPSSTS